MENAYPSAERGLPSLQEKPGTWRPVIAQGGLWGSSVMSQERRNWLGEIARSFEAYAGYQLNDGVMKKLFQHFDGSTDAQVEQRARLLKGVSFQHAEWSILLDLLTVHETYFYRDAKQLALIKSKILPRLLNQAIQKQTFRLRLWSAGCSTGEEAYMLAFLVLEELLFRGHAKWDAQGELQVNPLWNIEILGSDLSVKVLEQANSGRYRHNHPMSSFRELPNYYHTFFTFPNPGNHPTQVPILAPIEFATVRPSVRRMTRFIQQNLAEGIAPGGNEFDLVLCRNVLIYFQDATKRKVQQMLHRSLRKGGGLILGPPDVMLLPSGFRRHQGNLSVCYEKC